MKANLRLCVIALAVAGCATSHVKVHDKLVSANTPEERTALLSYHCKQEARALPAMVPRRAPEYHPQVRRFLSLCDAMAELDETMPDNENDEKRTTLARQCAEEITEGSATTNLRTWQHYQDLKEICEEMTGKPVNVTIQQPVMANPSGD